MEKILELLGVAGPTLTGVALGSAVLGLFWKGDDAISEDAREALSKWLQGLEVPGAPPNWPDNFIAMFDRIFGRHPFSWRRFIMSFVASTLALYIMISIYFVLRLNSSFADPSVAILIPALAVLGLPVFVVVGFFYNYVPDYFSLIETRLILDKIRAARSRTATLYWLSIDVVFTAAIFLCVPIFIHLILAVIFYVSYPDFSFWDYIFTVVKNFALFKDEPSDEVSFAVFFYTTFFTSFWIWIYVAARALVRGLATSKPVLHFLQWVLPIRSKPVRSIGEVAAALCCVGFWIFAWIVGADSVAATLPPSP